MGADARLKTCYVEGTAEECWPWLRKPETTGYGRFRLDDGTLTTAHRAVYMKYRGAIPAGAVLDHLCRNRMCVNPAHLEPVGITENVNRGHFDRSHCPKGHDKTAKDGLVVYQRPDGVVRRDCAVCADERRIRLNAARRAATASRRMA